MSKKILVAIHPGFTNTPALKMAKMLAQSTDVEMMIYSVVYDEHIPSLAVTNDDMQGMRDAMLKSEQRKLEQIQAEFDGITASVKILTEWKDTIAVSIANQARRFNADLVVVSSTRHSMMSRLFLSNTDWEILRCASTPVLFAHHHPEKAYNKIMVAVDPTHAHDEPAELDKQMIATGKWMAGTFNAELSLAHAYPALRVEMAIDYVIPYEVAEQVKQKHRNAIYELAAANDIDNEQVHLLDEHPREAIPELARNLEADLIIMGVVSRSAPDEPSIGHTAEYIFDHVECDVLTVPVRATKK